MISYLSHVSYHGSGWPRRDTSAIGSAVSNAIAHTTQIIYFACLEMRREIKIKSSTLFWIFEPIFFNDNNKC